MRRRITLQDLNLCISGRPTRSLCTSTPSEEDGRSPSTANMKEKPGPLGPRVSGSPLELRAPRCALHGGTFPHSVAPAMQRARKSQERKQPCVLCAALAPRRKGWGRRDEGSRKHNVKVKEPRPTVRGGHTGHPILLCSRPICSTCIASEDVITPLNHKCPCCAH